MPDVVGERADDADSPRIAACGDEPVEPVVGDFGVGLQHDHIAIAMQRERAIHCRGIALARGLLDQRRAAALRQFAQVSRELGAPASHR